MMGELPKLVDKPDPELSLLTLRTLRPEVTKQQSSLLGHVLDMPQRKSEAALNRLHEMPREEAAAELAKLARTLPSRVAAPSPNRKNGVSH